MGSTIKEFAALDANGQQSREARVSRSEKRSPSGSGAGDWLVNVSGDVVVPMSTTDIVDGFRAGKLSEDSLVWRLGMQDWIRLGDVPQLQLATGTLRPSAPPPAPAGGGLQQSKDARESARRTTLPYGFPAARDPASVREPLGLAIPSRSESSVSATRDRALKDATEGDDEALAVYDRPVASLTFSDSVRAEWHGVSRRAAEPAQPPRTERALTPVPAAAARFSERPRSVLPNSLIPTTSELDGARSGSRPPGHADLSVVLASDFRAAKASTKRVALWAGLGSAVVASALTLWLVRQPASEPASASTAAQPASVQLASSQPASAQRAPVPPALLPPVEPAASSALPNTTIRSVAPRRARPTPRPRRLEPAERVDTAPAASEAAPSDNPYGADPNEASESRAAAPVEPALNPGTTAAIQPVPATPALETEPAPSADPPSAR